jgi:hypothetical protein
LLARFLFCFAFLYGFIARIGFGGVPFLGFGFFFFFVLLALLALLGRVHLAVFYLLGFLLSLFDEVLIYCFTLLTRVSWTCLRISKLVGTAEREQFHTTVMMVTHHASERAGAGCRVTNDDRTCLNLRINTSTPGIGTGSSTLFFEHYIPLQFTQLMT